MDSRRRPPSVRYLPQHFLYFFPLPHGHGSLRPTFGDSSRIGSGPMTLPSEKYQTPSFFLKIARS